MKNKVFLRSVITAIAALFCTFGVNAAEFNYNIKFSNPSSHYVEVELNVKGLNEKQTKFQMPVWATGYYLILDSPKHVCDFNVTTTNGKQLAWNKPEKDSWVIENGENNDIKISYRVFANLKSVGEANVNEEKAYLAANEIFLYVKDMIDTPVTVTINPWKGWSKISTGLDKVANKENTFYAENFDVLYDCPIFIGNQMTIDFRHENRDFNICIARPEGLDTARFVADFKKVVTAAKKIIGDIPYSHYTLLMMEQGRGGLEHSNSQAIFTDQTLDFPNPGDYTSFMNFVSHEYFHLYNVKSIRPIELGPFDYSKENYTESLWISEGLTCFYEYVIMKMAGLSDARTTLDFVTENILAYEPYEGKRHMSLAQSSTDIWLNFFNTDENGKDVRLSYYTKGPVIGLLLDIAIRQATENKCSCDNVMQILYNRYFKDAKRGFTPEEFWSVCKEVSGSDLKEIKNYVYTTCDVDYSKYLKYAGLEIDSEYHINPIAKPSNIQRAIRTSIIGE